MKSNLLSSIILTLFFGFGCAFYQWQNASSAMFAQKQAVSHFLIVENHVLKFQSELRENMFYQHDVESLFTEADAVFVMSGDELLRVRGGLYAQMTLGEIGLASTDESYLVTNFEAVNYMAKFVTTGETYDENYPGTYLFLKAIDTKVVEPSDSTFYSVNRSGKLLMTSDRSIRQATVLARDAMTYYRKNPLTQGQSALSGLRGESKDIAFMRVPNSNVMIFSEQPRSEFDFGGRFYAARTTGASMFLFLITFSLGKWTLRRRKR